MHADASVPPIAARCADAVTLESETPFLTWCCVAESRPAPTAGAALAICDATGLLISVDVMPAPDGAFVAFWSFLTRFVVSEATPAIGAVDGAMTGMGLRVDWVTIAAQGA